MIALLTKKVLIQLQNRKRKKDKIVITGKGFFWNYPGTRLDRNKSINVLPERSKEFDNTLNFKGICSDYISKYKKIA